MGFRINNDNNFYLQFREHSRKDVIVYFSKFLKLWLKLKLRSIWLGRPKNIRVEIFGGSYERSFEFFKTLIFIRQRFREEEGPVIWSILNDKYFVYHYVVKYSNWVGYPNWLIKLLVDTGTLDWKDKEFTQVIFSLIQDTGWFRFPFLFIRNDVQNYLIEFWGGFQLHKGGWYGRRAPNFNSSLDNIRMNKYKAGDHLFISKALSPVQSLRGINSELVFNENRKFNFGNSAFSSWLAYSIGFEINSPFIINKYFLRAFQMQFNYSDTFEFKWVELVFKNVNYLRPIFTAMYDLPFLIPEMRPAFRNLGIIKEFAYVGGSKYLGIYSIQGGIFGSHFLFDRYLYEHAQFMSRIYERISELPESRYIINFSTLFNFKYSLSSFGIRPYFVFPALSVLDSEFNEILLVSNFRFVLRKRIICQIMITVWNFLSRLQPYFESVSFFMNIRQSFMDEADLRIGEFAYSRGVASSFLVSISPSIVFDRVTRRFIGSLGAFLYTLSHFELCFIFEFVRKWANESGTVFLGLSSDSHFFVNALTEFEVNYKGKPLDFFHRGIFQNLFFECLEQFYDYELYLYVFIHTLFELRSEKRGGFSKI